MKKFRFGYTVLALQFFCVAQAQITIETGIPSIWKNLTTTYTGYILDHHLKLGHKASGMEYGVIGIARFGMESGRCSDMTVGPYWNYTLIPFEKVPILVIPEIMLLATRVEYLSYFYRDPTLLVTGNIALGIGYEIDPRWSIISTVNVGYGKSYPVLPWQQAMVFDYPMGVSLGVKHTFLKKR